MLSVMLTAAAGMAHAKRRSIFIPTGSSSTCIERASDGTCLEHEESSGGGFGFAIVAILLTMGGAAFKLLRGGAGLVFRGAGAVARNVSNKQEHGAGDWAAKASQRFGGIKDEDPAPAQPQPAAFATAAPRQPMRGSGVVASGPRRSSGFGGSPTELPPSASYAETPVVAVSPALAQRAAVPAPAPRAVASAPAPARLAIAPAPARSAPTRPARMATAVEGRASFGKRQARMA